MSLLAFLRSVVTPGGSIISQCPKTAHTASILRDRSYPSVRQQFPDNRYQHFQSIREKSFISSSS
ncbi:hypothetical protein TGAM01_v202193 [Trichoderma gamsii]|uniref:Uncharacterized protein n=1 Tax=Trichoderma gamsii TaxID=398673 RepID=A0A2P4ZXQ7_9HYPO|nr:hypothetical protein TGAM01_v202193 [Trichoderma gamsii]PON29085.1 hypothetical protein TGAM01_v202193 [Trichoderma gamsii]